MTYAASFGNTTLDKLDRYGKREEVAGYLKRLDAVSARDANTGAIVESLTGETPAFNLDPVLAYDYFGECRLIPAEVEEDRYMIAYGYSAVSRPRSAPPCVPMPISAVSRCSISVGCRASVIASWIGLAL